MRLLPGRPDYASRRTAHGKSKTHTRSDTRIDVGQHRSLRRLRTHGKRGPSCFDGGLIMNIITSPDRLRGFERHIKVENVSRRSVLRGLGIAGGLVLAAPVMSRQAFAAYQTGAGKMLHGTVVDPRDRKSTRLNSSHQIISYAVFCLKKKKNFRRIVSLS